ncbi:MAG: hypothetical protein JSV24_10620 [Bacteroidales bacterium]|nr:MAG: hypothetical protein JSV24_10620 [Bacteroidales bacterium]
MNADYKYTVVQPASITGRLFYGILLFIWLIFGISTVAQDIEMIASIDSSEILIGDQTILHLEVIQPEGIDLSFQEYRDTITEKIEILAQSEMDTVMLGENRYLLKRDFLITCFDSGRYHIPPFRAAYKDGDLLTTIGSNPLSLTVIRVDIQPTDTTDVIFDIKLPYGAPLRFRDVAPYVLGGILLIGAVVFVIYYLKKRKMDEPVLRRIKPREPAHVIALRELDKLKAGKIWQQGRIKLYYTRLTEILRIYIEDRYNILAMEQTSAETLNSLLDIGFNDNRLYDMLKEIFVHADLAKFARVKPLPNENETCLLSAYVFVNETKKTWQKEEPGGELETVPEESMINQADVTVNRNRDGQKQEV